MLRPANVVDLPLLRALIRDGALADSFDRDLATESRESTLFFSNLRQALVSGYFVEQDPRTGDLATVAVLGYVYTPDGETSMHRPIGFGIFKAAHVGYELWLTGVDAAWRGHGHGRAMLAALLATDPGRKAYVVRVKTYGADSPRGRPSAALLRVHAPARNAAVHVVPARRCARRAAITGKGSGDDVADVADVELTRRVCFRFSAPGPLSGWFAPLRRRRAVLPLRSSIRFPPGAPWMT